MSISVRNVSVISSSQCPPPTARAAAPRSYEQTPPRARNQRGALRTRSAFPPSGLRPTRLERARRGAGNGLLRDVDLLGDFPDCAGAAAQELQNLDAARLAERFQRQGRWIAISFHK